MPTDMRSAITAAAVTVLVLVIIYRRMRRSIGRQELRPVRMQARMGILALVCVLFLAIHFTLQSMAAAVIGAAAGVGIALYALRHTRYETTAEGNFYTPHPYIGLGIAALVIARVAYRFVAVGAVPVAATGPQDFAAIGQVVANPLTLGLYFVMAGYYICFYTGVLKTSRTPPAVS
jgi:hypothetical protein